MSGVEMTAEFAEGLQDFAVEFASIEAARSLEERYEAIFMAGVLEHLYTPYETLVRVATALTSGGVLFLDVPNECGPWTRFGNLYMRLRGRDWAVNLSPTFPPFHVVGFCPSSLVRLLKRCGLDPIELHTYSAGFLPQDGGAVARLEAWAAAGVVRGAAMLGLGDGILCWAKKP